MKNNFQSKSVPRGTRTIWRYLSALFLLFTFAIGNVWAADPTHAAPATKTYGGKTFLDATGTPGNAGTDNIYLNYGVNGINGYKASWSWFSCSTWNKSNNGYSLPTGAVGFCTPGGSSSSEFYGNINFVSSKTTSLDLYVTGTTEIGFIYQNNSDGSNKWINITLKEVTSTGEDASGDPVFSVGNNGKALQYVKTGALDAAKYYHLNMATSGGSTSKFYSITFKRVVTSYTITYDKNGGDGTMENSTNTVSACTFTAPTGKEFKEWNTLATGLGDSYDPGDAASSDLDLFAIWQTKVEKFTVKYMDGTTELGSETVEVGQHPTGSEIAAPTKDCYTFAGWDPALSGVSGSDGDEVVVNATWTPNYAFGAYSFVNVSEVGTAPNKLTMSDGNTVNVPAGSRVDNFYFSAMAIKYESGASTALTDYKGWKINTKDATIKFLVENNSQVKVAIGSKDAINVTYTEPDGTAKNAISQGQQTEVSYLAKAGTLFTIKTATANTTTLKRITISPLYNATYTTSKSSVDPTSASNVTEVTLPTPNETTVGGYSFTGWIANQTVYKGETAKTAGEGLDAGETYTLTANTAFTAQWQLISDFDVKFFQGYGDPDAQIGETQSISTGNFAVAPEDPVRAGFAFLGWSYDATEAHIVDVATYGITAATNFTAMWKAVWTVTFDGAGNVIVEDGETVASPNSPVQAGKVFQGWYNAEVKYDFSATVTGNLALTSKWADADPNHYVYAYNDDFHFDGVVYKTPEGKTTDPEANEATLDLTTPYTLFSGAEGITSIVATKAVHDYKKGTDTKHVTAYLKLKKSTDDADSKLIFTIASGYTAVLKVKMGGYSKTPTVTLKKGEDAVAATSGTISGGAVAKDYAEITYNLTSGVYEMTTAEQTLYFSNIDLQATALPTHSVTYKPGDGEGAWVVDADATEVADCPGTFTAPTGKVFNGWKNESDDSDVAVGAIVENDMNLIAQWINVYAVTFNMNDHGAAIDPQDVKEGAKAAKPADPSESGWIFGGWFTDNGTFEAPFDFNTLITAATPLYAKWTEDPCPTPFSLSKVVLTSASDGTVTGYNNDEYAGEKVIGGLSGTQTAEVDPSHEGTETGYKLNSGGSAIVFATLKKGTFQEGDRVVVTITKKQDAYKVEEVAQPILDIYYGTNKDDATFLTTIDNVTAAGSYTYRLTAADVTAIGTKKGIGVFRPSSGRTQNPYVYSVEIQGCRSWAVSHGVTFNMMDHGTQVAPQTVPEGDKIAKPSVVEPEGWAFAGWYKESTLENEWDFTTDVMGTSDMTLYAKWESEVGVIKLFSSTGDLNTTNFVSAAKADDPIEIDEVPYPTLVAFGSNRSDLKGTTPADMVQYNATTNAAKIKLDLYNNASGTKSAYLWMVEEGDETATPIEISIPGKERVITSYYTFNSEKNRSFYLTSGAKSDIKVLQVKVMDNGTAIHQFGQAGYEVNLNKGRISAASAVAIPFEGAIISADAYSVLNSSSLKPKNYIQFNNAVANTIVKITKASSNKYYVTNDLENKGDEYSTDKEIVLTTTGTWYIGSVNPGSMAAFTKIEFLAPKCEQPAITPMSNSDLCEGDAFEALTVTASVSDGGTLHYAWFKEAGADDEAVGTDAASYTPDADGQYYVVVTNQLADHSDNSATSNTITVTHYGAPVITSAPLNKRGEVDDVVTLTVAATGKNVSYKWYTCDEDGSNEVALDPAETGTSLNVTVTAGMNQWYKVIVTSDCGNAEAKAKVSEFEPTTPASVTTSILWDWTSSVWPASGTAAFTNEDAPDYELLADADAIVPNAEGFRSDMLYGKGQYVWRSGNKFFQGSAIKFTTTVAGMVRVYFRSTKEGRTVNVAINGTDAGSRTNSFGWSEYVEVPAGEVEMICTGDGYTRIQKIEFLEIIDSRTEYAAKDLGTACYEYDALVIGATPYMVAGVNGNGYIVFDEITSGVIDAGYPYLFEAAGGKVFFCKPVGTTAAPLVSGEETSVKGMIGTFIGTTLTQGDDDICYFSGRHIWRVNDFTVGIDVDPHRCYVNYDVLRAVPAAPAAAPGRRRVIMGVNGKDEAQGFENLNASETPMKVMIDGTLYILRGEKVFDATGRLVK